MEKNTKQTVTNIFYNMSYGESYENVDKAISWIKDKESSFFAYVENKQESVNGELLQIKNCINDDVLCTEYVPEIETVQKILSKIKTNVEWSKANQMAKLLNKLAEEIEKNGDMLSQLEVVCRGILSRDTRNKSVPLLTQYFQYYSSFAAKYNQDSVNCNPEGAVVGIISNENILSNLGLILAPALAAGYNVILQVGTTIFPVAYFILELAEKVGIPEHLIRLIPSDNGDIHTYLCCENVAILTLMLDLNNEKYVGVNYSNKKILNLSSNKTSVIIFDNADLDSACASITDAAWGYHSLLPWSIDTILVQENISDVFLNKLKSRLKKVKIGLGNDKMVDISNASAASFNKLNELIKSAKNQGIEVFQAEENSNSFTPTLFIGGKVSTNNVLSADKYKDANVVTVLAFRSIDEAVNLANNSRQGLAASVWTENIGIVNEVAHKLKVSNIWINSHGLTAPEIALSLIKDSGVGYFGGKEGFYEYLHVKKIQSVPELLHNVANADASFINVAKKAQETWKRLSKFKKIKLFQKVADYIETNKENLRSSYMLDASLEQWIFYIYRCTTKVNNGFNSVQADFNVVSTYEPRGIIAIEIGDILRWQIIRLILTALFEGNSVILLAKSKDSLSFYNVLSKNFPTGVLIVLNYSVSLNKTLAAYKELGGYFGEEANPVYNYLPVKDSKIYQIISDAWDLRMKVTFSKNIWTNIGKSSTCNISSY